MNSGRNKSHRAGKEAIQLPNKATYLNVGGNSYIG